MTYTYIGNQSTSFLKAVSANANASFIQANSAYIHVNAAYTSQNTSGVYANAAYGAANVADQRAVTSGSYANSAYALANTKLASAGGIISGDLEVTGNLSVKGEFTSLETETVRIFDNLIDLNSNFTVGTPFENAGIRVVRGDETSVQFRWNESQSSWQFTNDGTNYLKVASASGETYANAAFSAANVADQRAVTSGDYANSSFFKANVSGGYANSSFLAANTADQKAVSAGVYANAAFISQNTTGVYANSAYGAANVADQRAVTSGTYANAAYALANISNQGSITSGEYANSAYLHANAAYVSQNTTGVYANAAYAYANTKFATAGGTISGDVVISGNLTIVGNTVYANTETVVIKDNILTLNGAINQASAPSVDAGLEIDRGSSANVSLLWNETTDSWTFTNDGTNYSNIGSSASESYANSAYIHSNASYNAANTADQKAVSAGFYANTSYTHANSAYLSQNSTGNYANSSYTHANAAYLSQNTTGIYTNTAYTHANAAYVSQNTTGVYANGAYLHANAAYQLANVLSTGGSFSVSMVVDNFTGDGTTNQFFLSKEPANEDYIIVSIEGITQLKSSYILAGTELIFSEPPVNGDRIDVTIFSSAQLDLNTFASNIANSSAIYANGAFQSANSAGVYANAAYAAANSASAVSVDSFARNTANSASSYANGSFVVANTADQKAVTSGDYANSSFSKANTANTLAQAAYDAANNAVDTWVRDAANSASSYANSAYNQANTTNTLAQSAFDAANNATDSWVRNAANSASSYANGAFAGANTSDQRAVTSGVYANAAYGYANTKLSTTGGTVSGDLTVTGNLVVSGNVTTVSANNLAIQDNMIYLNDGSTVTNPDLGFAGNYNDGTYAHAGLFRDASDGIWKFYDSYIPEPDDSPYIDTNHVSFNISTIQANLISDNVLIRGYDPINHTNSSFNAVNSSSSYANSSFNVANTANTLAQASFDFANTLAGGTATDGWARNAANSASSYANSSYNQANTADQRAVTSGIYANSGYSQANTATTNAAQADQRAVTSGIYANSGYSLANTANILAQAAFNAANNATDTWVRTAANSASSYANGAFAKANTSLNVQSGGSITGDVSITGNLTVTGCTATFLVGTLGTTDNIIDLGVNTTGAPTQNSGIRVLRGDETPVQFRWNETNDHWHYTIDGINYIRIGSHSDGVYANAAFSSSNSASSYANSAYGQANTATTNAAQADQRAVTSGVYANAAFAAANNAVDTWVRDAANSASIYANSAFNVANVVNQKAAAAYHHANASYNHANTANVLAQAAYDAANNAVDTWVRDAANSASSYANGAFAKSNTADQKAVTSGIYANSAFSKSNSTFLHAAAAFDTANTIIGGGNFTLSAVVDTFTGDGVTDTFTLSIAPLSENYTLITIEGVSQLRGDYSVSGTSLIFSEAPENGARIDVTILSSQATNLQDAYNKANAAFVVANNSLNVTTGGTITGNLVLSGNIVPSTDNTYFLGSDANRWHTLYVGPGSVDIDGIVFSNTNGVLTITGTDTIQIPNLPDFSSISSRANTANNLAQAAFNAANTKSQFTISSLPPVNANPGDRWFDSDIGQEFVYVDDGDSQQWVELSAFVDQNYVEGISYYRLENDHTGLNSTESQSFFGVGVQLISNTLYEFESIIYLNKSSGSNSHILNINFGGTSNLNNILYTVDYNNSSVNSLGNLKNILINTTSNTAISENVDTNSHILKIKGSLSVNTTGSFVPNYKLSEIPGSSFLTKKGSYFKMKIIGGVNANNISIGSWA